MRQFTLYTANTQQRPYNLFFQTERKISDEKALAEACRFDYTPACFKEYRRMKANFLHADCVVIDVDNAHTDDPTHWLTPEAVPQYMPGVEFLVHFSRNHMRPKDGKTARPKFHLIIPTERIESATDYEKETHRIHALLPGVDGHALDAGRMFFGTEVRDGGC